MGLYEDFKNGNGLLVALLCKALVIILFLIGAIVFVAVGLTAIFFGAVMVGLWNLAAWSRTWGTNGNRGGR